MSTSDHLTWDKLVRLLQTRDSRDFRRFVPHGYAWDAHAKCMARLFFCLNRFFAAPIGQHFNSQSGQEMNWRKSHVQSLGIFTQRD